MGVINFGGALPVAIVLQWKGETVPNAVSDTLTDFRYIIANESVSQFAITAKVGADTTVIRRTATPGARFFDVALNTYTTSPVSGTALDAIIAAGAAATCTIDLTFTFRTFFDKLLEQMTRTDADLRNLANPNDSAAILDTFAHDDSTGQIRITYKSDTQALKGLPCTLVDQSVTPRPGKAPAVKLVFELDFTPADAVRREAMRKLIAMDWSKLARFGKPGNERTIPFVAVWLENVKAYLINQTDTTRAERFFDAIVARHSTKSPLQLSKELRDDIDLHLITANHWGQKREDMKTERHQRLLSDLFGTLHQSAFLSSPVSFLRLIEDQFLLLGVPGLKLALQYGVGHCGEHAHVSFDILSDIISLPGSQVTRVVRTGNANIDHAFCVYNLDASVVVQTLTTNPGNGRTLGAGRELMVWNLRDAIAANVGSQGFVMDPYLDTDVMKATAAELLDALNNSRRQAGGLDTDFLGFADEFPRGITFDDIRSLSDADRRARVKNV